MERGMVYPQPPPLQLDSIIDIKRCKNRLLKFCYVPATSAAHNKLLFFAAAVYSTNEANKAGLKQSIFLDVYG
jgi:hypothetical protein